MPRWSAPVGVGRDQWLLRLHNARTWLASQVSDLQPQGLFTGSRVAHLDVKQAWLVRLRRHVVEAAGHAALQVVQRLPEELRKRKPNRTQRHDLRNSLWLIRATHSRLPCNTSLASKQNCLQALMHQAGDSA